MLVTHHLANMKVIKLENGSRYTHKLPEGCIYCAEGSKMVLLVTGRCEAECWYCPLSEKKKDRSVVYADEKKVENDEEILSEARSIDAAGTGITGGDPLITKRSLKYIELLKREFGEEHHIHLYTQSTNLKYIERLYKAGLDEIRFHPPVTRWNKIEKTDYIDLFEKLREKTRLDVGIEIPVIPGMKDEILHLIKNSSDHVSFLNLNELEFSSTNTQALQERGYEHKSDVSSGVKDSEDLAYSMLNIGFEVPLHYCSLSFKDGVQLTNRIKRRAQNVAKKGDIVTEDGTLIRGLIESEKPKTLYKKLKKQFGLDDHHIWYDSENDRLEGDITVIKEMNPLIDQECYGIELYPTSDHLEVERWPLS